MNLRNKASKSIFLVLLLASGMAQAAAVKGNVCSSVFTTKDVSEVISSSSLEKNGFKIEAGFLFDTEAGKQEVVGIVRLIDAPLLYEWAPHDYQKIWMENGGLSKKDVNESIEMDPQKNGRGYYVSTSPFDSTQFGDALSVFKTEGTMVTLLIINKSYSHDLKQVMRLQKAGVDAFSDGKTWLSMISAKHLKKAEHMHDPVWNNTSSIIDFITIYKKIIDSNFVNAFSDSTLIGRMILDKLTDQDKAAIKKDLIQKYFAKTVLADSDINATPIGLKQMLIEHNKEVSGK